MGKWKYLNWVVLAVVITCMYAYFYRRYEAPAHVYVTATAGWLLLVFLGYYIFCYRLKKKPQPMQPEKGEIQQKRRAERPKVGLKKNKKN